MRRVPGWRAVSAMVAAVTAMLLVPAVADATAPVSTDAGSGCRFVDVPMPASVVERQIVPVPGAGSVAGLLGGTAPGFTIHGRLCLPGNGRTPKTVMLALHGILYTNAYWNVGFEPETYNYSRYMTRAGYAVFAIDRLGYGRSSKPPAALVTLDAQAEVAHQIIGKLRAGEIGGHRFRRVMLVGYSYGTATSWRETAKYNDADALLTTAWGSTFQNIPLVRVFSTFRPAQLDPRFRNRPIGYFTSPVGRDQNYFYDLSNVDPRMVKYSDEQLADTITAGEMATFYPRYGAIPIANYPTSNKEVELPLSQQTKAITVPTFLINGTGELFFCGIDQQHCTSSQKLQI
ncbi:MAG TPA: alpha/beta hydrolase family protein, partial [Pseudonocardia sp.]